MSRRTRSTTPPEGLLHLPAFLSEAEELALLGELERLDLSELRMHGVIAKRRVAHFGFDYAYDKRAIAPAAPVPAFLEPVRARLAEATGVEAASLEEVLVTCYPEGAGIGWHRDAPMFGKVAVVSLLGSCKLRFRTETESWDLPLAKRDAYVLTGAARKKWQHGIDACPERRWSISFRTVHSGWKSRAWQNEQRWPTAS